MKKTKIPVPLKAGGITVTVSDPARAETIQSLARSIEALARALSPVEVAITDCTITNAKGNGISITV